VLPVALHRVIHEYPVEPDAGVVDVLVEGVGVPFVFWEREVGQPVVDREFHLDVAPVVGDELLPTVRIGCRRVTQPALVEHAGCGRGVKRVISLLPALSFRTCR